MGNSFVSKCDKLLDNTEKKKKKFKRFCSLKELCMNEYTDKKLVVPIGKMNDKENVYMDFTSVNGLFIAGSTGTGKSIFLDSLIVSLMLKNDPDEVKFVFLEEKGYELGEYNGINYIYDKASNAKVNPGSIYKRLIRIWDLINYRILTLQKEKCVNITSYNKKHQDKWPHLFFMVDEGNDLVKNDSILKLFFSILAYGKMIGIHLVFATNAYLKDYVSFIDRFKYKMSFDLASDEQAKYIDLKDANWLNGCGEGVIKGTNSKIYSFQAPYVSNDEIERVILEVGLK